MFNNAPAYTRTSKMKRLQAILAILFLCISGVTFAQPDSSFKFLRSIKGEFSWFNVDNLNNVYELTIDNQLKKIDENGDSVAVFNDVKRYGNPYSVDVTNPLKILLYYKNFSTVVILDRLLTVRNTINFRDQNIFSVRAIATSYDNNIWIFDEQDYKLKKIDETGKMLQETTDWRSIFDFVPSPTRLIDRDNYVYLYDAEKGFYVFDYYSGFKKQLPFMDWSDVEVSGKNIYGFHNRTLYSYELNSFVLKEYKLPVFIGNYRGVKAMNGKVYFNKGDRIDIYQVK